VFYRMTQKMPHEKAKNFDWSPVVWIFVFSRASEFVVFSYGVYFWILCFVLFL
jgi:hypothetical protein